MKSFIIKNTTVFYCCILFLAVFDIVAFLPISAVLKTLVAVPFLLFMPGYLMTVALKLNMPDGWGKLAIILGCSVTFLLFAGFIGNQVLPVFGIPEPLSPLPMACVINMLYMGLINSVTFQRGIPSYICTIPAVPARTMAFFLFPLVLPCMAAVGALMVNNHQTNIVTLVMLGSIALYTLLVLFFRSTLPRHIYPYALYLISLSLLLMTSLRGWYITGHDIQPEYFVFQLTKEHYFWNMHAYRDAYNACLSITMLPTILVNFTGLPDPYIYKLLFQGIFAIVPVIVFLFLKTYTRTFLAFLCAFYFLSFPTFMHDMPMLNRQEISFLFFFLLLYVLFHKHMARKQKKILSMIFACSMVVSHYSTTYISLGILGALYASRYLPGRMFNRFSRTRYLSIDLLLVLTVWTLFWNVLLTKTSNGLVETVGLTLKTIHTTFQEDNKSSDVAYSIFVRHAMNPEQYVARYIEKSLSYLDTDNPNAFYPPHTYADYKPDIIPIEVAALKPLGQMLERIHIPAMKLNALTRQMAAQGIQVLIGIGCIWLFFSKSAKRYDSEYVIGCYVSMAFIALMIILPSLSLGYGLLRLFQQSLFFLSFPLIMGSMKIIGFLRKNAALPVTAIGAVLFFLTISGFFSESTGGYYPQLHLNNTGVYYDSYYMHASEIASALWLKNVRSPETPLQSDSLTASKLQAIGGLFSIKTIFPNGILKSAYVYLGELNVKGSIMVSVDQTLMVKTPIPFLDKQKNLIYNNGFTRIYK